MQAAFAALGEPGPLEVVIMQLVNIVERGERAQMSKRKGEFVTLDELIDDIGVDAARFFLLQRSHDTTLDLDLDLARERSQENPVYYVQYAHARIASILRNAGEERLRAGARRRDLARRARRRSSRPSARSSSGCWSCRRRSREAAERRAPHRLTAYAHDLASDFHAFYRDCRVVGRRARRARGLPALPLRRDHGRDRARCSSLLGVEAPEQM